MDQGTIDLIIYGIVALASVVSSIVAYFKGKKSGNSALTKNSLISVLLDELQEVEKTSQAVQGLKSLMKNSSIEKALEEIKTIKAKQNKTIETKE